MKNLFVVLLFFILYPEVNSQLSIQDRLNSSLNEAESYLSLFLIDKSKSDHDCPPRLINPKNSSDSSMYFLSAVDSAFNAEKTLYLARMMENDCRAYYSLRMLDKHHQPIYGKILKEYDIPEAYEILPLVMSASNPNLRIEGDKAGLWQLNYINARRFGLRVDNGIDDRFDITRSTLAAIQYLLFLEEYYRGDKLLVVSAFYSSVPYINKTLSSIGSFNEKKFINALNKDVQHFLVYYHSWIEWKRLFKETKIEDPIAKSEKGMKELVLKDSISIDILSEFLGLDSFFVRSVNPVWVGKWLTAESNNYPFQLPKEKVDFINDHYDGFIKFHTEKINSKSDELAELKKRLKNDVPDPKKYKAISYKVKSGDVLGLIAQRYGVKVSSIKKWNKLSSDRINIGQVLVLYVPKSKDTTTEAPVKEEKEEFVEEKIGVENTKPKPGKGTYTTYVVKQGESLWIIARKFPGVSSENIMEWNGINDKIKPGQELKIYSGN